MFGSDLEERRGKDKPKAIQSTSRNKHALMERTKRMDHGRIADHLMGCCDSDCEICDMGESGEMIDKDDEGRGDTHNYGTRSSKEYEDKGDTVDREGSSVSPRGTDASKKVKNRSEAEFGERGSGANLVNVGDKEYKSSAKHDKHNLMRHGQSTSHPGFAAVQSKIASKQGISQKAAGAILASRSRSASAAAHKANPRLNRVKG